MRKRTISIAVLITLIIVLIAFIAYVVTNPPRPGSSPSLTLGRPPQPTGIVTAPTPYLILPTGKQTYLVRSNPKPGDATVKQIVADPIESAQGDQQTFSLDIASPTPVAAVSLELTTDNQTNTYQFKLVSGNNKLGTWSGTWVMADPHRVTYFAKFIIKDEGGHITNQDFPIR